MRIEIDICLIPISKLAIIFAMLTAMTEKLGYGVIDAMKYQFLMAGLVKNLLKWIKFVLDKYRILWYNTDVVERLGNLNYSSSL